VKKALLVTCLVLSGCDSNKLSDVEKASKQASTCKVHQIMPNECSKFDEALGIAELKATQAGIEHERIVASRQIGEKVVSGNISDSPYQRVKRSLESHPFYIDAVEENFISYKEKCPEFGFDEGKPDIEKLTKADIEKLGEKLAKAMEWIGRDKKQYQAVAYFQKGKILTVLFAKAAAPCRTESYSEISDQFPIITEDQLTKFKNGEYLKSASFPSYKLSYRSVSVIVFDTHEEAIEKYHELTGQSEK